jgi:hypothetical protein
METMRVTVQERFRDVEFGDGRYLEIRLRAKTLGTFKAGDMVEVVQDENGRLILAKSDGSENKQTD